ncbi:MarR family transcriptional regulator [Dehalobacterium formicoaceticum]|uniref:MarR family winged helix-turn-helix transcriptional regulator n=1 Tax=Dehalobacterium formicoaceticum TaxID=51515 RepID=UPI0031F60B89
MFDIDTCLYYITGNSARKINEAVNERVFKNGVTSVQWIALYNIGKYEKISQTDLCHAMNKKPSTVARLIDRMEKEGYVLRQRSSEDRRVIYLSLTDKGTRARVDLLPKADKLSKIVSKGISEEHLAIFKNVLKTMSENVSKEEE